MRDLNRKLQKFLKEKAAKKGSNASSALTPHVTYGIATPTANKKSNGRNFSMTVSFFNPKFEKSHLKDFVIIHENTQAKQLVPPSSARSPKRNPILQDNDEPVQGFRPVVKPMPMRMTLFDEEPTYSRKIAGEYNTVQSARSLSPRKEGVRVNISPYKHEGPETVKRQLREVKTPHLIKPNPITEGDMGGVKLCVERKTASHHCVSEEMKKMNDKKFNLPTSNKEEKGESTTRGRVFWDTNVAFGDDNIKQDLDQKITARTSSPQHYHKTGRDMKGLLGYEHAPEFRDQGVSIKVNAVPISHALKTAN